MKSSDARVDELREALLKAYAEGRSTGQKGFIMIVPNGDPMSARFFLAGVDVTEHMNVRSASFEIDARRDSPATINLRCYGSVVVEGDAQISWADEDVRDLVQRWAQGGVSDFALRAALCRLYGVEHPSGDPCKACGRYAALVDGECPDCRH